MRKLLALAALVMVAGCAGVKIDGALLTGCVIDCMKVQPVYLINAETGDTLNLQDYREWILRDDGTLELKDPR